MKKCESNFFVFDIEIADCVGHAFVVELQCKPQGLRGRFYQSWADLFCLKKWLVQDDQKENNDKDRMFQRARNRFGMRFDVGGLLDVFEV